MRVADLRQAAKPARDFVCSLIVFFCLFVAMSPVDPIYAPLPVISLVTDWSATDWDQASTGAAQTVNLALQNDAQSLSGDSTPLISTLLALVFASMMTFSLGLIRYLRRANASSRREAWKSDVGPNRQTGLPSTNPRRRCQRIALPAL